MRRPFVVGLASLVAQIAGAQTPTGTFTGIVTRDTLGHPVKSAEVRLTELGKSERTDAQGGFRFAAVPVGHYTVTVRAIGFEPFVAAIVIATGQILDGDLTLTPASVLLDTVKSLGARFPGVPWMLQDFESRRRTFPTGQFLSDSALRSRDDDVLVSLVGMLRGARLEYAGVKVFLSSARAGSGKRGQSATCRVAVYVDGIEVYPARGEPPDFAHLHVSDYSGVEFYASASEAPAQFSKTGSGCGVAVLWTRQR